jgi:hypothetical protein
MTNLLKNKILKLDKKGIFDYLKERNNNKNNFNFFQESLLNKLVFSLYKSY